MSTKVQAVIFDKNMWSVSEAKKWLRENDFVSPKVDPTDRYLRFRQIEPDMFKPKSFRTIPFGDGTGIKAIIGVPIKKKNPFYGINEQGQDIDQGGDGHRIGAYAMLFTKARNEYLLLLGQGAGDSVEAQLALAKAKEYWEAYQRAREYYTPIEDRREYNALLHEFGSFENAIKLQLPKRKNPMSTRKNPVIDGKTISDNLKGLRKLIGKSIPATEEAVDEAVYKVMSSLEKINDLGIKADMIQRFKGFYKNTSYQYDIFKSSMGELLLIFTQPKGSKRVKVTLEYLLDFPLEYTLNEMIRDGEVDEDRVYGFMVKKDSGSKYLLEILQEHALNDEALKEAVYIPEPEPIGISPKEPINIYRSSKSNPMGTAYVQGSMLTTRYNPVKKINDFEEFMDKLDDGNVFVGRYVVYIQDGVPMRLEVGSSSPKQVSPEVAFFADLAADAVLVGQSNIDAFSEDYKDLIRQAKIQAKDSKPDYFAQRDKMVKEGKARKFLDTARYVKPLTKAQYQKALEAFKEPEVRERTPSSADKERAKDNAAFVNDLVEGSIDHAERGDEKQLEINKEEIKKIFKKFMSEELPFTKEALKLLQKAANNKRAKKLTTLLEKTLARIPKLIEERLDVRVEVVDDKGKKSTATKEAKKDVAEVVTEVVTEKVVETPADDPVLQMLKDMAAQSAAFKAQFKNNPRGGMHYAYPMSTLDHNHTYSYEPLNNVYIKKNPEHDYRFPQIEIKGVLIDNDIYSWLMSGLPNWQTLIDTMRLSKKYNPMIPQVEQLQNDDFDFIIDMQTRIVPAVEEKVRKQLESGKTLDQIIAKLNPRRNPMRRRYY